MKNLVNGIQYLVVVVMLSPIYYVWQSDKVNHFCEQIEVGMSKSALLAMADEANVNLNGPQDESVAGGKWKAFAEMGPFFSGDVCQVKGVGDKVAIAKIYEE